MRILMQTLPGVPFGADWARAAAHRVEVETFQLDGNPAQPPAPATPEDAGRPHALAAQKLRPDRVFARWSDRRAAAAVVRLARDLEAQGRPVEVLHGHFYSGARSLPRAAAALGIPLVVTEHSTRITGQSAAHKPFTATNRRTATGVYGAAAAVLAVSEHLRDCIVAGGLAEGVHVTVVPNPVEHLVADERVADDHVAERLEQVVSVGRLEADKGTMALLDAVAQLRRDRPALRLVLVGDGPLRAEVEARVRRPDLAGAVEVLGRVPRREVGAHLARSRCFALGSTVETFCIAAAEAVLAGVPVVMPRLPPVVEVVGPYGVLVADSSASALATGLAQALDAPAGSWPEAARAERARRFAPAAVGDALAAIYERVAAR